MRRSPRTTKDLVLEIPASRDPSSRPATVLVPHDVPIFRRALLRMTGLRHPCVISAVSWQRDLESLGMTMCQVADFVRVVGHDGFPVCRVTGSGA